MVKSCSITGRVELLWKNCILPEVSSSTNVYIEDHYINWLYQLKKQSREDTLFSKWIYLFAVSWLHIFEISTTDVSIPLGLSRECDKFFGTTQHWTFPKRHSLPLVRRTGDNAWWDAQVTSSCVAWKHTYFTICREKMQYAATPQTSTTDQQHPHECTHPSDFILSSLSLRLWDHQFIPEAWHDTQIHYLVPT